MNDRILLVDDDSELRACLNLLLGGAGYKVSEAANGREALHILESQIVDLVITDLLMPEMEGIETIFTIRREVPGVPIIAISGGGVVDGSTYLCLALKIGVVQTFQKPINSHELVGAVREVFRRRVALPPSLLSLP